jgi:hypothetical protein
MAWLDALVAVAILAALVALAYTQLRPSAECARYVCVGGHRAILPSKHATFAPVHPERCHAVKADGYPTGIYCSFDSSSRSELPTGTA